MGKLYDQWVGIILRDAREVTGALDRVVLTSDQGRAAYAHLSKLTLHLHTCFEAALTTRYGAHNPYGLIASKNAADRPWFKPMARRIHRAIVMEMLALHMLRLEFALLLTRLDNITKRDLLPQEFEDKYTEHMAELHTYLVSQPVSMEPDVNEADFVQNLSDLERMLEITDHQDIPRPTQEIAFSELNTYSQIMRRRLARWIPTDAFGALNVVNPVDRGTMSGAIPHVAGAAYGFWNFSQYSRQEEVSWGNHSPGVYETTEDGPASMWFDAVGQFRVKLRQITANYVPVGPGAVPAAYAAAFVPDFGNIDYPNPAGVTQRAWGLETRSTPNCVRFCAYDAVCTAARAYVDPAAEDNTFFSASMTRSDDAFQLLMNTYSTKQALCVGFSPRWTTFEDRQWLAQLMERPTEYAGLFYMQANAVPGQYVMQRNQGVRITPRLVVHLWRRRIQEIKQNQLQLWALTHCEAPLMADLLYSMGPIIAANRRLRLHGAFPAEELAIAVKRLGLRFEPALCFETLRDATIPAAQVPFWNAAYNAYRALREPDPHVGDTTQPMSEEERTWLHGVHGVFQAAWAAGGAPPAYLPVHTRWAPLILNATRHPSYDELPPTLARPAPPADVFENHNVVCKTELPEHIWQVIYRRFERLSVSERNALLSAYTFNSLFMTHFLPALEELLKIQPAIQGFPLKFDFNNPGQHTMSIMNDGGVLRAYNLVVPPGGGGLLAVALVPAANDFQLETGFISRVVQNRIASFFAAPNANIAIRFPSVTQMMAQFKVRVRDIQDEYKARRAPFTAPRFWLMHDPLGVPLAGVAAAQPPWVRVDPRNDAVNGVLIHIAVAAGVVPAAVAADIGHRNIIVAHHLLEN